MTSHSWSAPPGEELEAIVLRTRAEKVPAVEVNTGVCVYKSEGRKGARGVKLKLVSRRVLMRREVKDGMRVVGGVEKPGMGRKREVFCQLEYGRGYKCARQVP